MSQNSDDDPKKNADTSKLQPPLNTAQSETDDSIHFGGVLSEEKWSIIAENSSAIIIAGGGGGGGGGGSGDACGAGCKN